MAKSNTVLLKLGIDSGDFRQALQRIPKEIAQMSKKASSALAENATGLKKIEEDATKKGRRILNVLSGALINPEYTRYAKNAAGSFASWYAAFSRGVNQASNRSLAYRASVTKLTVAIKTMNMEYENAVRKENEYNSKLDESEQRVVDYKNELLGLATELKSALSIDLTSELTPETINEAIEKMESDLKKKKRKKDKNNITKNLEKAEGLYSKIMQLNKRITKEENLQADIQENKNKLVERWGLRQEEMQNKINNLAQQASQNIRILTQKITGIFAKTFKSVLEKTKNLVKKLIEPFNKVSKEALNFKEIIKKIVQYGFGFRSLYYLLRRIRSAFTEGIKYLGDAYDEVKQQIYTWREFLYFLKASLGTILQPILNIVVSVKNYLEILVEKIREASKTIATFFATFAGQDYIYVATDALEAYKEAVEEVNNSLGAYDKLNTIGDSDADSLSGLTTSGWFTKEQIDTSGNNFVYQLVEAIKKAWADSDFTEVGKMVGTKIVDSIKDGIHWDDWEDEDGEARKGIKTWLANIAKDINTFIVNLFGATGESGDTIGSAVGEALGNAIAVATSFVKTAFSPETIAAVGTTISDLLNSFLNSDEMSITEIGQTIRDIFNTITDVTLNTIRSLPKDKLKLIASEFFKTLWTAFRDNFSIMLALLTKIGPSILSGLADSLLSVFHKDTSSTTAQVTTNGGGTISNESISQLIRPEMGVQVGEAIGNVIASVPKDTLVSAFTTAVETIWNALTTALSTWAQKNPGSFATVLATALGLGALNLTGDMLALAAEVTTRLWLEQIAKSFLEKGGIAGLLNIVKTFFAGMATTVSTFFTSTLPALFASFATWITGTVLPFLATIGSAIVAALPYVLIVAAIAAAVVLIVKYWDEIVAWFKQVGEELGKLFSKLWDDTKTWFKNFNDDITQWLNNAVNKVYAKFTQMKEAWSNLWKALKEVLGEAIKPITDALSQMWDKITTTAKTKVNILITWLNKAITGVLGGLNKLIDKVNSIKIDAPSWVTKLTGITTFGFNLKKVTIPQIPLLAQGAVIPPNKQFLAMLGDQTHGTNVEAPLETIKQAVADVIGSNSNQPIILQVDGKTLAKIVWDENEKKYKQMGKSYAY